MHPTEDCELAGQSETPGRRHVLTVDLQDYYSAAPVRRWVPHDTWYRFEWRVAASTQRTLEILDRHGARATFFIPGYIAERIPDLVADISRRGHEVASSGYSHRSVWELGREAFRDDVRRARELLEDVTGRRVLGFRMPQRWLRSDDLWVFEVLEEAGYRYDSSVRPLVKGFRSQTWQRKLLELGAEGRSFYEVPVSSVSLLGIQLPVGGGGSLRLLPEFWMRSAVAGWVERQRDPYVMYFRTWELDPDQPRISLLPLGARVRQYARLDRMPELLGEYLGSYRFTSVAAYYEAATVLPRRALPQNVAGPPRAVASDHPSHPAAAGVPIAATIVVPCFNETQSLGYLRNTLRSVAQTYRGTIDFAYVFVDDCSTDGTWTMLQSLFGSDPACRLVRHEVNKGIAGTIRTGIEHARTDVVCSIDCDCTYDPHELGRMIPLLVDGVHLVTASPYHPDGRVRNIPGWRLFLSKSLSRLYRVVLHQQLFTYTSCFRVYRRASAAAVDVQRPGFLGIAELIARLDLEGGRVVEYPTTLESRVLGRSKMKIAKTILGHVGLLSDLVRVRLLGRGHSAPAKASL